VKTRRRFVDLSLSLTQSPAGTVVGWCAAVRGEAGDRMNTAIFKWIGGVVLGCVAFAKIIDTVWPPPLPETGACPTAAAPSALVDQAEKSVREGLLSPLSAFFPDASEGGGIRFQVTTTCDYTLMGKVDSMNPFGVMLRSNWVATLAPIHGSYNYRVTTAYAY
jgi:hypothetical protein